MSKLIRGDVVANDKGWEFKIQGQKKPVITTETKEEMLKKLPEVAETQGPITVKIHKKNGEIQDERTYQRKDDPRKSKG